MNTSHDHTPLQAPKLNKSRAAVRMLIEAAAQVFPATAMLARVYQDTYPSKYSQDVEAWYQAVTDRLNDHDVILRSFKQKFLSHVPLGTAAFEIGVWLSGQSKDGLPFPEEVATSIEELSHIPEPELREACYELKDYGLVTIAERIGRHWPRVWVRPELYWMFDPISCNTDPAKDAAELGAKLLQAPELQSISKMHNASGWDKRRLNPAVSYLMQFVDERRISKVIQHEYIPRCISQ